MDNPKVSFSKNDVKSLVVYYESGKIVFDVEKLVSLISSINTDALGETTRTLEIVLEYTKSELSLNETTGEMLGKLAVGEWVMVDDRFIR